MQHHLLRFTVFFLALLAPAIAAAQDEAPWSGFGIEANAIAGKVWRHENKFTLPLPKTTTALDLNFTQQTYGKKDWQQRRKYPMVGVGFTYTNYGLDAVYGRCISLYPNITLPLARGDKLEWTLRIGDGVGYVTRDYSRQPPVDTVNIAIGSHINDFAIIMTDLRYHVNPHWDVQVGANFSHISDASFLQPNLGVNVYGAHIGLRYFPVTSRPKHIVRELQPLKKRWLIEARAGLAFDQVLPADGPLYPVYIASLYASKRWHSKNKVFGGIDYSYHESIYTFLRNNEIYPGQEALHSYKSAIFAGNEFLLGHVGIMLQLGVYIQQAALKQDPYYEKIGGNYYLVQREKGPIKELFLSALLKTHKSIAELMEFGVGMGF